jgi:hypothetical protein
MAMVDNHNTDSLSSNTILNNNSILRNNISSNTRNNKDMVEVTEGATGAADMHSNLRKNLVELERWEARLLD